jgi:hypothetical protein
VPRGNRSSESALGDPSIRMKGRAHGTRRTRCVALPFRQQPVYQLFEYACHERNYSVRHIVSGERAAERAKVSQ